MKNLIYFVIWATMAILPLFQAHAQESAFASAQKEIPLNIKSLGTIVRILPPEEGLKAIIDISNDSIHSVDWHRSHVGESKDQLFSDNSSQGQVLIALAEASYNAGTVLILSYNSTVSSDKFDLVLTNSDLQNGLTALEKKITNPKSDLAKILDGGRVGFPIPLYIPDQGSLVSVISSSGPLTVVIDITNTTDAQKFHWMRENETYLKGLYLSKYPELGNTMISLLRSAYYIGTPLALKFISSSSEESFTIIYSIDDMAKILSTINK